jgi:GDP-mannose 6-dehydrogenase
VVAGLKATPPARILDLNGRLGVQVEQLPGYEGIGWCA